MNADSPKTFSENFGCAEPRRSTLPEKPRFVGDKQSARKSRRICLKSAPAEICANEKPRKIVQQVCVNFGRLVSGHVKMNADSQKNIFRKHRVRRATPVHPARKKPQLV